MIGSDLMTNTGWYKVDDEEIIFAQLRGHYD